MNKTILLFPLAPFFVILIFSFSTKRTDLPTILKITNTLKSVFLFKNPVGIMIKSHLPKTENHRKIHNQKRYIKDANEENVSFNALKETWYYRFGKVKLI